jgi:hypothetical protein
MRIFTGKDYYDIGLSGGHDDSLVFQRREDWLLNSQEIQSIGFPSLQSLRLVLRSTREKKFHPYGDTDKPFVMNGQTYQIYPVIVGFCGRVYYAYATRIEGAMPIVHWVEEDFSNWLETQELEVSSERWSGSTKVKSYYAQAITPAIYSWMVAERITTLSYVGDNPTNLWRINAPSLKELQFAKVFDPYMAFQEITMWIGGVLSGMENPTAQITDDMIKAEKHGFDRKLSFRKAKAIK